MKLDRYVLEARVVPLVLAVVPIGVLAGLLGWTTSPVWGAATGLGGTVIFTLAGADVVRSLGRDLESQIWDEQGGSPTTLAFLEDSPRGADRRSRLEDVTGVPVDADRASVERAATVLRDLASDHDRFPRIPIANANYGRARHLLALRPYAIVLALAGDVVLAWSLSPLPSPSLIRAIPSSQSILGMTVTTAALVFWLWFPTRQRLHRAAEDYADRLLSALDVLRRA